MIRWDRRRGACPRGVSFPELMVVIALLALAAMISVPIAAHRMHELRLRSAAERFAVSLRASRMIAVTTGRPTTVTVLPQPDNRYSYLDSRGRLKSVTLPPGLWIEPGSTPAIVFMPNGALDAPAPATTVLRATLAGQLETWIVTTPRNGIPTVSHHSAPTG